MLEGDLEVGREYRIAINYTGLLNDLLVGFYRSQYAKEDGSIKLVGIIYTQVQYSFIFQLKYTILSHQILQHFNI